MNNKEFITELSRILNYTSRDATQMMNALVSEMTEQLEDENQIAVQGFGTFEVKKKLERVVVNPTTRQRMLVPPKLVVGFKPGTALKDRIQ